MTCPAVCTPCADLARCVCGVRLCETGTVGEVFGREGSA